MKNPLKIPYTNVVLVYNLKIVNLKVRISSIMWLVVAAFSHPPKGLQTWENSCGPSATVNSLHCFQVLSRCHQEDFFISVFWLVHILTLPVNWAQVDLNIGSERIALFSSLGIAFSFQVPSTYYPFFSAQLALV